MFPAGLMAALLFTLPALRKYQFKAPMSAVGYGLGGLTALGMIGGLYGMFIPHPTVKASGQALPLVPVTAETQQVNWSHYGSDAGGSLFAALDQINRDNVSKLKEV